jgi:hypothetical protein
MNEVKNSRKVRLHAWVAGSALTVALLAGANVAQAEQRAVMAVDSTFSTLDPYDANDTLRKRCRSRSTRACSASTRT